MSKRIFNDVADLDILHALYRGNHLDKDEVKRAYDLLHGLKVNLDGRVF